MSTKTKPKSKGTRVLQKEKKKMWELYQELGSYSKVGRKLRRNPDTVSRYVQEYEQGLQVAQAIINRDLAKFI